MPEFIPQHTPASEYKLDDFTVAYLNCAEWLLPEEDQGKECFGWSDSAIDLARDECEKFQEQNSALLDVYYSAFDEAQAGHDFWLTRNRHGSGFWDCEHENEDVLDKLTESAQKFDEIDVYIGDDGYLYFE